MAWVVEEVMEVEVEVEVEVVEAQPGSLLLVHPRS